MDAENLLRYETRLCGTMGLEAYRRRVESMREYRQNGPAYEDKPYRRLRRLTMRIEAAERVLTEAQAKSK